MRSRKRASISACSWALDRLVNGKAARLRARRIRLEMTMSDSGPVPRSHSPLVVVNSSRFIRGFLVLQEVSDPGGFLIVLVFDGFLQLQAKGDQLDMSATAILPPTRGLADMASRAMNSAE